MAKPKKRAPPAQATRKASRKTAKKAAATRAGASARKAPARAKPTKRAGKAAKRAGASGKAEGDAAVRAAIRELPAWQRAIAERIDGIIAREVPGVKRAIKWSMPLYGQEAKGWFAFVAPHSKHVSLGFYSGTQLAPPPPEGSGKGMRHVRLASLADVDEARVAEWVRQAAALPGWAAKSTAG